MWSSAAVAHRLQGFDVLCVQGCFSVCHCAIRWLFQSLLPSCQLEPVWLFSCDLSHNKPYSPTVLTLTAFFCFVFLSHFSMNSQYIQFTVYFWLPAAVS